VNSGQSCIAAKRFIVADEIYDQFETRFVAAMEDVRVGDPMQEDTQIGPLATKRIVDDLEAQVKIALGAGARGLAASAWTREPSEQQRLVTELECGQVFLNAMVASDPRLPFGGVKRSGSCPQRGCASS
jgi:acyl-CoA reductase-like NAD-dependent aldehyde dehydrogenase